ncbi:uncharacterized protein TNIN_138411 [Trichonephila inaurata madagascariensis]|uniref:Uncharacterized protein n=1 Tax=Trichonephila inaurata madagascariensis TaxID=2747483 RepID=A0A8X6YUJ9_9ARAC|nr:uncharacterized protein TNIN_138411 [Trichonephila inaurata madagascariensis]
MAVDPTNKWRVGNVRTVGYCTFCVILVGFAMLLGGAILSGIAYTEVRPNVADENYERYIRSDPKRVVGPIMLAFGLLCIFGGCIFFGLTLCSATLESRRKLKRAHKYNVRASAEHLSTTPDVSKKMLSDV